VQPDLKRIELEAERLEDLVTQVMTLTRLRTATEPKRELLQLDKLVADIIDDARFEHPNRCIEYFNAPKVQLRGDAQGLKSAVENVVRNALAYSPPDGPIEVQLTATDRLATLRVRDRGPGVAPEELTRIFEPFYRTDKSRDHRNGAGQGIGLAITARVMELHGGRVAAQNRAGGGLEVILELPLGPAESTGYRGEAAGYRTGAAQIA
jgi:signal transduction histidine kinase